MFCLLPHIANGLTALPFAINIRQGNAIDYWWGQIYGRKSCCWFIGVDFIEDINQFSEVLHY